MQSECAPRVQLIVLQIGFIPNFYKQLSRIMKSIVITNKPWFNNEHHSRYPSMTAISSFPWNCRQMPSIISEYLTDSYKIQKWLKQSLYSPRQSGFSELTAVTALNREDTVVKDLSIEIVVTYVPCTGRFRFR